MLKITKNFISNGKKINWLIWLILVIFWNYYFPEATPFQDVIVAVILSIFFSFFKTFKFK